MSDSGQAVFLSYASQDTAAAKKICEALRAGGVEVWFDQNELVGGDAWDAKIRQQIAACALFVPVISANTQARLEGYFRLEWKLAAQRTHTMADEKIFLLPVVVDETREAEAKVPAEFKTVQWTRLPAGEAAEKFCARVRRLAGGDIAGGGSGVAAAESPVSSDRTHVPSPRSGPRGRLSPAIRAGIGVGIAALVAIAAWPWWRQRAPAAPRADPLPAATSPVSSPAPSKARALAARAQALRSLNEISRERLGAAEELANEALKLDSTDPDVHAIAAQIDAFMVNRGFDISEERRQSAARHAARALALAPRAFEPRHAQAVVAGFMVRSPEMQAEAETIYRDLLRERPEDADLREEYGALLQSMRRHDEAAAAFLQAKRALPAGWACYAGARFEAARKIADELLAEKRTAGALVLKANVELFGFGDRAAARAAVDRLTPTELMEDTAAGIALRLAVVNRDSAGLLKLLGAFSNPFLSMGGTNANYPRQYWTGFAQLLASHPEAAQSEWRGALRAVQERLDSKSDDAESLGWAAMLHALLGESEEAERSLRLYASYRKIAPDRWDWLHPLTRLHEGGHNDEVLARLAGTLRSADAPRILYLFARYSPEFDPLRADPRFEALLRETLPAGMTAAAASAPDEKSVAVLAFENRSDDRANEYFSDGISEELLTVLRKIPGLRVAARTSSFSFKGKNATVREVGSKLGCAHVVEGSVQKIGQRVKITARLSRAATDEELWSESFGPLELNDVFATQSEIAQAIVEKLRGRLGGGDVAAIRAAVKTAELGGTRNAEAHQLFLRGQFAFARDTVADIRQAREFFEQAVQLDPDYAQAWLLLGATCSSLAAGGFAPFDEAVVRAKTAAARALSLMPRSGVAHALDAVLKMNYDFDFTGASRALETAVALEPDHDIVLQVAAFIAMVGGDADAARRVAQRATERDPLNPGDWLMLARAHRMARRFADSEAAARRILELSPTGPRGLEALALALFFQGRLDEMAQVTAVIREENWSLGLKALWHAARGDRAAADEFIARFEKAFPDGNAYQIAELHAYRGEKDQAFQWLEHAFRQRDPGLYQVAWDPFMDPLHEDPRWRPFLAQFGRAPARQK